MNRIFSQLNATLSHGLLWVSLYALPLLAVTVAVSVPTPARAATEAAAPAPASYTTKAGDTIELGIDGLGVQKQTAT